MNPIEALFARPEPRARVRDFMHGLLAPLPVKNCWTIAEHAGDDGPGGMRDLIGRACWDDALVREQVRAFVAARLGHPDGILVVDETGDLKKGTHTVGVQRQYSGTAGKIENCQLAVHLSYASPLGHTLIDVALYLPKSWTEDPQRRIEAGVPETVTFATKPQLARRLIETALTGGLPCEWVAGDEAYGGDPQLATALRGHQLGLCPRGRLFAPGADRSRCPAGRPDRRGPAETGMAAHVRRCRGERSPLLRLGVHRTTSGCRSARRASLAPDPPQPHHW
jgi:SRSO17 transposase